MRVSLKKKKLPKVTAEQAGKTQVKQAIAKLLRDEKSLVQEPDIKPEKFNFVGDRRAFDEWKAYRSHQKVRSKDSEHKNNNKYAASQATNSSLVICDRDSQLQTYFTADSHA